MENSEALKLANALENYVNVLNMGKRTDQFIEEMSRLHRTNQQSFTRLMFAWLEHVASEDYRFDPRNQDAHEMCKKIMSLLEKDMEAQGFTGATLKMMSKPSGHLGMV